MEKIAPLLRNRQFQRSWKIGKNSPKAWCDLGQFSQSVAHPSTVIIQARRPCKIVFDDLDDREVGKRFVSFVAVPDGALEANARRILGHFNRESGLTHAGSIPEHENRSVAGSRTIDRR